MTPSSDLEPELPLAPESPVEKRIDNIGRGVFERAVSQAAEIATQNVAQIHRRRLVTQSFLAAFFAACLIGLILALVFKGSIESAAHANSITNCELIQRLEHPLQDFIKTDAALRRQQGHVSPQIQRVFEKLLGKTALTAAEVQSARLNQETTDYWLRSVVPRLDKIGGAPCSKLLH